MFYIVISDNEEYGDAADLIIDSCRRSSVSADIIGIEGVKNVSFGCADIVFFLTNDRSVGHLAVDLSEKLITIINGAYIVGNRTKSYAQQRVRATGVAVPWHLSGVDLRRLKDGKRVDALDFPLYVKSECHVHGVFRTANREELWHIIAKIKSSVGWYLEKDVDAPDRHHEKLYWVAGYCFGRDGRQTPRMDVVEAMDTVGTTFSLDVFSADFIVGEDGYWCIDVNPAPGLFGSKAAREVLVGLVRARLARRRGSFAKIYRKSIKRRGGPEPFILHKMERSAGALVRRLQRNLPRHARIIEVGAGTAAISAQLAKRGFDVTAVDRDEAMLPMMSASFEALGAKGSILVIDGFTLDSAFTPKFFDCAISHGVMEHYSDANIAHLLRVQFAVAKCIVFVVPTVAMSDEYRQRGLGDERYLPTRKWRLILKRAGFDVKAVYGFGFRETKHPGLPEALWHWNSTAKLLAPLAAFNEFWIEAS